MEGKDSNKTKYLGISVVILSLLVTACVVTVIFMAMHTSLSAGSGCQPSAVQERQREKRAVVDDANLKLKDNGKEEDEEVEYDESRDVAFFYRKDGYFFAEDFEKGINILRDTETGYCYVIPVGSNITAGHELRDFVRGYQGQEMEVQEGKTYRINILPGEIQDTSFLPPEADSQCLGYNWLSIIGEDTDTDEERTKRAIYCTRTTYFYYRGSWYRLRYTYRCA